MERLTLAVPSLARLARLAVLRLPTVSRIRRALLARVIRDAYEAYNRRDWDALLASFHPDFERHSTGSLVATMDFEMHSRGRGREGYLRLMERWFESYGVTRDLLAHPAQWLLA